MRIKSLACLVAGAMATGSAFAEAIVSGFDSNTLGKTDDGYTTSAVDLGFTINFFGKEYSKLYVNNNGNVTFDEAQSAYTPYGLTSTNRVIIAPFFADVDTRFYGSAVSYGVGTYDGQKAFGVNWVDVSYFGARSTSVQPQPELNSFQLILVDRSDGNFDIVFNYGDIQWDTGRSSNGQSAYAGWSNGTGEAGSFYELPGSGINGAFLNGGQYALASASSDSTTLFHVVGGTVSEPISSIPEPETWAMLLAGLGIVGTIAKRRRA